MQMMLLILFLIIMILLMTLLSIANTCYNDVGIVNTTTNAVDNDVATLPVITMISRPHAF